MQALHVSATASAQRPDGRIAVKGHISIAALHWSHPPGQLDRRTAEQGSPAVTANRKGAKVVARASSTARPMMSHEDLARTDDSTAVGPDLASVLFTTIARGFIRNRWRFLRPGSSIEPASPCRNGRSRDRIASTWLSPSGLGRPHRYRGLSGALGGALWRWTRLASSGRATS